MSKLTILFIILLISPTQLFSQTAYFGSGDQAYVYHDAFGNTYYTFDYDRGKIGQVDLSHDCLDMKYPPNEFDSLYTKAYKFYGNNKYSDAEVILRQLISYIGTEKEPNTDSIIHSRRQYSIMDAFYLLRDICFEQVRYKETMNVNDQLYNFVMTSPAYNSINSRNGWIEGMHFPFMARYYLYTGSYDSAAAISINYVNDRLDMAQIFVNSLYKKFGTDIVKKKFLSELNKIDISKNKYEMSDDSLKKFKVGFQKYVELDLIGYKVRVKSGGISEVCKELTEEEINKSEANEKIREVLKQSFLYNIINNDIYIIK